jgi:hypothetical protein
MVYTDEKYPGLQVVSSKDQPDDRDDLPQNPHAFDKMVLDHLSYGHGQSGCIDFRNAANSRNQGLQDSLAYFS